VDFARLTPLLAAVLCVLVGGCVSNEGAEWCETQCECWENLSGTCSSPAEQCAAAHELAADMVRMGAAKASDNSAITGIQANGFDRAWCRHRDPQHACLNGCLAETRRAEWRRLKHRYLGIG
jgi:hypothetical protein